MPYKHKKNKSEKGAKRNSCILKNVRKEEIQYRHQNEKYKITEMWKKRQEIGNKNTEDKLRLKRTKKEIKRLKREIDRKIRITKEK